MLCFTYDGAEAPGSIYNLVKITFWVAFVCFHLINNETCFFQVSSFQRSVPSYNLTCKFSCLLVSCRKFGLLSLVSAGHGGNFLGWTVEYGYFQLATFFLPGQNRFIRKWLRLQISVTTRPSAFNFFHFSKIVESDFALKQPIAICAQ